eukprot:CAMPEP_0183595990 /NCGR_PEP_ID=MMETSP0371-20130417/174352_1 /TAXON_ID=268820 /ORGANISM="Peridinium aciculiferum, Strain PAER-2" /LENGTH=73 /DNA_ID=CAMNT_0025807825 /DNA_START=120 /DNA_END=339 /DNA_ORIENTATION=-
MRSQIKAGMKRACVTRAIACVDDCMSHGSRTSSFLIRRREAVGFATCATTANAASLGRVACMNMLRQRRIMCM